MFPYERLIKEKQLEYLKKMGDEEETFTENDAAKIFKQIISAICYCHN